MLSYQSFNQPCYALTKDKYNLTHINTILLANYFPIVTFATKTVNHDRF